MIVFSLPSSTNTLMLSAEISAGGFTRVHNSLGPLAGPLRNDAGAPVPSGSGKVFG